MAFDLENMTVDYKTMFRMVPSDRLQVARSGVANDLISSLTPGQLANLFPSYYRDQLPDIGQSGGGGSSFGGALSGGTSFGGGGGSTYSPNSGRSRPPKSIPAEEKAIKELMTKAGIANPAEPLDANAEFVDPRTSGKLRPEILEKYKDQKMPVSIRNNNMGAISLADESNTFVTGMSGYVGMTARPSNEGGYYAKFATPEHGVAAASKNLENYGSKGINTPSAIVRKWAIGGNQNYINTVLSYLNQAGFDVNSNTQLDLSDPRIRAAILKGKSAFESGAGMPVYTDDVYDNGVNYSIQSIEAAAEKIQELNTVIASSNFDPNTIGQLDERLQKWYKDSSRTELQRKQFEASLSKLGVEEFNQTMKRQPINSATIMSATGAPIMLPVGGTMAGQSITSGDAVPFSGGAPGSRSFGGPRGTNQLHTGVDIPGAPGDPVIAVDNGTVVGMRKSPSGYGYILDVQYGDGTVHRMAHLGQNGGGEESAYAEGLKIGDNVAAGQQIGILGYSGNAGPEFPHVHYEVIRQDYYEKTQGSPPGRIAGRGDAAEQQLEAGRIDPREWYARRQEEFLKQQEQAISTASENPAVSDPVAAAQNNMQSATPLPTEKPAVPLPATTPPETPAVAAPGLSTGGTVPMTPGENIAGVNTTTGKVEFMSNDRELYTKDDQGNLRVDPSTIRQDEQAAAPPPEDTQKPDPVQPVQQRPQQPMPTSVSDPNFLNTMSSGSMASSPSQLRALNRAKLYGENSGNLVNGHFS